MKKIIGLEFKRFYNDETFWDKETYCEDAVLTINNLPFDDSKDPMKEINDTDTVSIQSGFIMNSHLVSDGYSLQDFFKKWYRTQTITNIIIEVDKKEHLDHVKELKRLGYKVVS